MEKQDIMKFSPILPENFTGVFYFTNWTDEDFVGTWNGNNYTFPANATSPIVMRDQTPVEIQSIRKKFAKDLAEKVFSSSEAAKKLMDQERNTDGSPKWGSIMKAGVYTMDVLAPYIQRCLEPLAVGKTLETPVDKQPLEEILHKDEEGEFITEAIDKKVSLKEKARNAGKK